MKTWAKPALMGAAAALMAATFIQPATGATGAGAPAHSDGTQTSHRPDNRPGPLTEQQNKLRAEAVSALVSGKATKQAQAGGGSTVSLGKGKAVEFFDNNKQAKIFTVLAEFGDEVVGRYGGTPGPRAGKIPQPDPKMDNSTIWTTFDQAYYEKLFNGSGESLKSYYRDISGGRYTVDTTVTDWVRVRYNAAYYGSNPREDQGGAWDFVADSANAFAADYDGDLDAYLSQFDKWDRYDFDADGNFNEADGYIDHFQAVHAGEGEEAGASPDMIWSHRWYAYPGGHGTSGPTVGGRENLLGGTRIGNSSYWIGDYTVEPENGGLGVFVHEYAHDLGLPDFYDTAGGDNGTGFWTVMSSGSWLSHEGAGIGSTPNGMGPEERLRLGWLDYATVAPGGKGRFTLRPAGATSGNGGTQQAVLVDLPDAVKTNTYVTPPEGGHVWWSGKGDELSNTMTRTVKAATAVTVTANAAYNTEKGYDFLYAEYSLDGGQRWQQISRIDGSTNGWRSLKFSYRPNGAESLFRLRYQTDQSVQGAGVFLDQITVDADRTVVFSDGAESGANGWTLKGWTASTGTVTNTYDRYYLLENRAYVGYDATLETGPYNFTNFITKPLWVEHFAYQDGMLVWFVDEQFEDNNTSQHPGHGMALPVDARPDPFYYLDAAGNPTIRPGNRRQPFDATFGTPSDGVCLHREVLVKKQVLEETACAYGDGTSEIADAPVSTFTDANPDAYYSTENPLGSVKVAGHGVVATATPRGQDIVVEVTNP